MQRFVSDNGLTTYVGRVFLPALYPGTTNGRPAFKFHSLCRAGILPALYPATTNGRLTIAFNPQARVGRACCPPRPRRPRMVALQSRSTPNPMYGGHLARLVLSDHEWSPYTYVQGSSPCRAGIAARLAPGDHEWSPYIRKPLERAITLVRGVSKLTVL
jgi:hypothetical protein